MWIVAKPTLSQVSSLPSTSAYDYRSVRVGSDGFVLAKGNSLTRAKLVSAGPCHVWCPVEAGHRGGLRAATAALAADASSGATVTMGGEGMHFFRTTISSNTLAWRLV